MNIHYQQLKVLTGPNPIEKSIQVDSYVAMVTVRDIRGSHFVPW